MAYCTAAAALILALATASCATNGGAPGASYGMAGRSVGNPATGSASPLAMDPQRKIAEQDCSKPVALDQGNLRCK